MKTENWTIFIYTGSLLIIHLVYIAVFLGIFVTIPEYIRLLNISIQVFLCLILMFRFHSFRENHKLQPGDTMFIFGAAFILFTNVGNNFDFKEKEKKFLMDLDSKVFD